MISTITIVILTTLLTASRPAGPELQPILDRQDLLTNVKLGGELTITYSPPKSLANENWRRGSYTYAFKYSFFDGRFVYDFELEPTAAARERANPQFGELLRWRIVSSGERVEQLSFLPDGRQIGKVTTEFSFPVYAVVDLMLGLRRHGETSLMGPREWHDVKLTAVDDVVEVTRAGAGNLAHRWKWVKAQDGIELIHYSRQDEQGVIHALGEASDFVTASRVRIPQTIIYRNFYYHEGKRETPIEVKVKITDIAVGDEKNAEAEYSMMWPPSTVVYDDRIGYSFRTSDGKEQVVTDREIFERATRELPTTQEKRPPSHQ